jgi:hypothetical protein
MDVERVGDVLFGMFIGFGMTVGILGILGVIH